MTVEASWTFSSSDLPDGRVSRSISARFLGFDGSRETRVFLCLFGFLESRFLQDLVRMGD